MAFVKVVGGTEIYNFCVQSLMHFYTKFWSFSILNHRSATLLSRTPPVPVRHASCPQAAGRGVHLPQAPHPENPRSPRGPRAPRRAVPARGSPRTVGVNTKNWYRKGTDLWADFGNEMPFGRKNLLGGFGKDACGRQYAIIRQKDCLCF
jgi:hypothetical protein